MQLRVPIQKMLLPDATLAQAKRLVGFDVGLDLYYVLLFDFGDDGGAIGVWKEGDDFCARITLDALAGFHAQAKATHIEATA
jgi:hypothetical protein